MKKLLINLGRVLISVGILLYLFNNILQDETESALQPFVAAPSLPATPPAGLTARQASRVYTECRVKAEDETFAVDLAKLPRAERLAIVWKLGPDHLGQSFQKISLGWFALAVALMGGVIVCGVLRWQWILRVQGLELTFWRACSISFIGMFFNAFMLGATGGDVMKALYIARETHHKKAEAVASVIVDRIIGLLVLFVIALVMMLIFWRRVFDDPRLHTFAVFTLLVVLGTVGVTVIGFWKGFADKLPGLRRNLERLPKYDTFRRMVDAYRVYATHPAVLLRTALITVGVHVCSMLSIVCIGRGLGITQAGLVDYFLYLPIINSIAAVPISISGFGVREGMYVTMFDRIGVPGAAALAMSLLGYLAVLIWSVVGAGFYLTHRKDIPSTETMAQEE
jgi:uncharacterized protein (TIRG00374 family)